MNLTSKLEDLSHDNQYKIYQEITKLLSKKWYLNRWLFSKIYIENVSNYLFYPTKIMFELTKWDYDKYYSKYRWEIKTIINIWFNWFKPYNLKFPYWRKLAVKYCIRYHYYKILSEL